MIKSYNCKICRKHIIIEDMRSLKINQTCSDKCYKKLQSILSKGKNNGNYKHGLTLKSHYCINCKNHVCYNAKIYGTGLCIKCRSKILFKGKKRPLFSASHIQHMRENQYNRKGRKNPNFGKGCHSKNYHYKGGYYKGIWMRSSWEIKYAKYLDKNKIKWKYEYKAFDLGESTYTPDFYLPKTDEYIEIKGWWRNEAKRKLKIFKKIYSKIKITVLNKKQLKELKII